MGGRGGFKEEVEDGCGRWEVDGQGGGGSVKRRRSQKRGKAVTKNNKDRQYTTIKQNKVEVGRYVDRRETETFDNSWRECLTDFHVFCFLFSCLQTKVS